ncbi:MAG: trypsin-like peptidase domain-containing protein, partial [Chloroflexota bacterium]|nr:trypsin-like peptidase domain-containing protein [Chloroflexota bacterium]
EADGATWMNVKRLGILSGFLALVVALGLAFGAGTLFGNGGSTALTAQVQQFAAAAPATTNTGTITRNAPAPPSGTTMTTEQIVDQVGPAVVTVINRQKYTGRRAASSPPATPPAGGTSQPIDTGLGSGVIYDKAGYILTNNHVVEGATAIDVELADGSRVDATLVGRDPSNDVAVVKIDPAKVTAVAELGDSSVVKPGQPVVAIGSPEALENSVTEGIVSGVNRQVDNYVGLIQTDAAINHGNSGGPLINAYGQVIGLNTLGIRDNNAVGLNFAIPINKAKQVAGTLVTKGNGAVVSTRAYLGVQVDPLNSSKAAQYGTKQTQGAYVVKVETGTPAEKAGLQKGDVITAVNGTKLDNKTALGDVLSTLNVGDTATLTIDRTGQTQTLTATLAERPTQATP